MITWTEAVWVKSNLKVDSGIDLGGLKICGCLEVEKNAISHQKKSLLKDTDEHTKLDIDS